MFNTRSPWLLALPLAMLLLAGCGQTGPLQLPPRDVAAPVAAPAAAEPATAAPAAETTAQPPATD